jgi:hypothetical protein
MSDDQTQAALLGVHAKRVVDFLLRGQQFDVAQCEGVLGETEVGTDHWKFEG